MTPRIVTTQKLLKQILTPHHKIVFEIKNEDEKPISIKETRTLIQKISFSSGEGDSIETYLINNAHTLTTSAQNNLLKTLEETAQNKQIILITETPQMLLSTILSRCHLHQEKIQPRTVADNDPTPPRLNFNPPLQSWKTTPGQIPELVDQLLKNNDPYEYLKLASRKITPTTPTKIKVIKYLHQCLSDLNQNINPKLALDHFFIKINT
jgi:hypothetical protein